MVIGRGGHLNHGELTDLCQGNGGLTLGIVAQFGRDGHIELLFQQLPADWKVALHGIAALLLRHEHQICQVHQNVGVLLLDLGKIEIYLGIFLGKDADTGMENGGKSICSNLHCAKHRIFDSLQGCLAVVYQPERPCGILIEELPVLIERDTPANSVKQLAPQLGLQ